MSEINFCIECNKPVPKGVLFCRECKQKEKEKHG